MQETIFKNYGVLGHEKKPFYSLTKAECAFSEKVTVEIPDEIYIGRNYLGDIIVNVNGYYVRLMDVLTNQGDNPALQIPDTKNYKISLKVLETQPA